MFNIIYYYYYIFLNNYYSNFNKIIDNYLLYLIRDKIIFFKFLNDVYFVFILKI